MARQHLGDDARSFNDAHYLDSVLISACKPTPCCHSSPARGDEGVPTLGVKVATNGVEAKAADTQKSKGESEFHEVVQKCLGMSTEQLVALCKVVMLANNKVLEKLCKEGGTIGESLRRVVTFEKEEPSSTRRSAEISNADSLGPPEVGTNRDHGLSGTESQTFQAVQSTNAALGRSQTLEASASQRFSTGRQAIRTQLSGPVMDRATMTSMVLSRDSQLHGSPPPSVVPIVQFQAPVVYVKEDDEMINITLMRIGSGKFTSKVRFETRDGTAKAGQKYVARTGEVVFEEGENTKTIQIETVDDDAWDATTFFQVHLIDKGIENARMGKYLWNCTVKIIDDDAFPTNAVRDCAKDGNARNMKGPNLLFQYFRMNFTNHTVRRGTLKTIAVDQLSNFYFIFILFLELLMVDKILPMSENYEMPLIMIAILRVLPCPFINALKFRQVFWRVGGASRKTLQSNLLRKFLNYTDESRDKVDESRLILAMTRDAEDLVEWGYLKVNPLIANLTRLVMVLVYQAVSPYMMGKEVPPLSTYVIQLLPALVFPVLMLAFLRHRNPKTIQFLEAQKMRQNEMFHKIKDILENMDIIKDYGMKDASCTQFDRRISAFNDAFMYCAAVIVNNKRFAPTLTLFTTSFYTVWGGMKAAGPSGALSLGTFLNTLQVYTAIGDMWGEIYEILLDMQNTFEALNTMVEYMNLPVDVENRMLRARRNAQLSAESYNTIRADASVKDTGIDPADLLCIELSSLSFKYKHTGALTCDLRNITASLPQGAFYCLIGPPSEGKGTILKLLCDVILPYMPGATDTAYTGGGDLIVPSHLRQLHVLALPKFVEGTLYHNLTFGVAHGNNDGHMDRVLSICRLLGVSESTLLTVEKDDVVVNWTKTLSATEASLLHIARALIANPEVLCIHKPSLYLNNEMGPKVYEVLRMFCAERGLCMDPAEFYARRPRTCIVTSRSANLAGSADAAYFISKQGGMQLMIRDLAGDWTLSPELIELGQGKPTTFLQW